MDHLQIPAGREGVIFLGGPYPQLPPHRHRELEFNLVVQGTARYLLRDRQYHLRPGSLIWLFPEQGHVLLDRTADYSHWIVCFAPRLVNIACRTPETVALRESDPTGWFCAGLSDAAASKICTLIEELAGQDSAENDRFNAGMAYLLLTAWSQFQRASKSADQGPETFVHTAIQKAIQLIRETIRSDDAIERDLPVPEIARRCGMSSDHLSRLFRREIGIPLVVFRNQERLRRFIEVYGPGNGGTLLETALDVGFGSYAQFHRVFCQEMGMTPQQYRRLRGKARQAYHHSSSKSSSKPSKLS